MITWRSRFGGQVAHPRAYSIRAVGRGDVERARGLAVVGLEISEKGWLGITGGVRAAAGAAEQSKTWRPDIQNGDRAHLLSVEAAACPRPALKGARAPQTGGRHIRPINMHQDRSFMASAVLDYFTARVRRAPTTAPKRLIEMPIMTALRVSRDNWCASPRRSAVTMAPPRISRAGITMASKTRLAIPM